MVWLTSDEIFSRRLLKNSTTTAGQDYYYYFFSPRRKSVSDFLEAKKKDRLRENLFSCYAFVDAPHLVTRHLMMTILHVCNGNLVFLFSLNFWKKFTSAISNFPSGGVHTHPGLKNELHFRWLLFCYLKKFHLYDKKGNGWLMGAFWLWIFRVGVPLIAVR